MKKGKSDNDRVAYNGLPLKEGEVLVPMIADENFIATYELTADKVRRWSTCGVEYKVAFYAVPAGDVELAMKEYRWEVNQLLDNALGENRGTRCLIPQADGSFKVCPKKRGDNRPACKDCPYRGLYEKEDKAVVSIEELGEEYELCPAAPDDTETEVLYFLMLEELMECLKKKDIRSYTALSLCADGMDKKDIVHELMEKFGLKKSVSYDVLNKAIDMVIKCLNF